MEVHDIWAADESKGNLDNLVKSYNLRAKTVDPSKLVKQFRGQFFCPPLGCTAMDREAPGSCDIVVLRSI